MAVTEATRHLRQLPPLAVVEAAGQAVVLESQAGQVVAVLTGRDKETSAVLERQTKALLGALAPG